MNIKSYRRRGALEQKRRPRRPASYAAPANIGVD
jgi:hypothetical protein